MKPRTLFLLRLVFGVAISFMASQAAAGEAPFRYGEATFKPAPNEEIVPEQFRLTERKFTFRQEPSELRSSAKVAFSRVTFPSPVESPLEANNTVHCELFLPKSASPKHKVPGVVVLHILGGDFFLARIFAEHLAERGVATLFLIMPHYGPRRTEGNPARMVSDDPQQTVLGMRQAVLDIRCGAAFLSSQPEIDPQQLGIMGISLGGITSALAAEAEPRFTKVGLLLAGGDISRVAWESKELRKVRERWLAKGGTRESLVQTVASIDPITYAKNLHGRKVLMLNASQDEIIPKACTEALWKALGEPEIHWWDTGHISAAKHILSALEHVTKLFVPEKSP